MAIGQILLNLWTAFTEIIKSIFHDLSIFWFLGPVLLFWLILEVYFSKYKREELGWNTALGNGLSVFWVLIVSIKYLFEDHMANFEWPKFIALMVILVYAFFIIINSFSHKLKANVFFLLASPTIIYYLSGVAILWTYGELKITTWVLIVLVICYGLVLLFELILKKLIKGKESGLDMGKETDFGSNFGESSGGLNQGGNLGGNLGGLGGL